MTHHHLHHMLFAGAVMALGAIGTIAIEGREHKVPPTLLRLPDGQVPQPVYHKANPQPVWKAPVAVTLGK